MENYDVIILGGGPGGYVAAIRATKRGRRVLLIEQDSLGGTCLNRGCIPTKALLHSSGLYHEMREGAESGILTDGLRYDFARIAARRDGIVKKLTGGVAALLKGAGVTTVKARGVLKPGNAVEAGGKSYTASAIILATGSAPAVPPIPGADLPGVMNSDGALALSEAPHSVVVVGGGVIGIELTTFFAHLGIPVTVLEFLPDLLSGMPRETVQPVLQGLKKAGVKLYTGVNVKDFSKEGGEIVTAYADGETIKTVKSQIVIVATGRRPMTRGIGLEEIGVQTDARGYVTVDSAMRTNIPGIYAIGDITGKLQLAHVASAQGVVAADHIAGIPAVMRYEAIPACVYTTPEIASVGLTEAQAREKGRHVKIGSFPVPANGRSMIHGAQAGVAQIITDESTGEILGAHICAPNATEMIAGIALGMNAEATVEELAATVHPHPTVSEIIMEAAHDIEHLCVHKL